MIITRSSILASTVWAAAVLAAGVGCGGSGNLVKTVGLVTLDGKPVEGATVTFHPEAEKGRAATGLTDGDGVFHLQTFAEADGAFPGEYKVTVIKTETMAGPSSASGPEQMMKTMFNRSTKKRSSLLPKEYADVSKTPLRVHVPHEGQVELQLKKGGGS
jgi:hypothetical protein